MIATRFAHFAPASAGEAVALLTGRPDARVLGGGTWVVPEMSRGLSRPSCVVDLRRANLAGITETADGLHVGAMTSYAHLLASEAVIRRAPLLRLVAAGITGGWAIRNQGTVGGSAIAARPPSDIPAALVACGARAVVAGPAGVRRAPAGELFAGAMRSTLAADEVLTGFDVPATDRAAGYIKLKRGASSWPIATAAALVAVGDDRRCTSATLVLGAVAATPLTVDLDGVLVGQEVTPDVLAAAARHAGAALTEPWNDALAPGAYRAAVAAPMARRALTMACDNARHGR